MKRYSLLNFTIFAGQLLCYLQVCLIVVLTLVFIHVMISPSFYAGTEFVPLAKNTSVFSYTMVERWGENRNIPHNTVSLDQVEIFSLIFNYLRLSAILLSTFLATKEFLNILRSVKFGETFRSSNVYSFRRIGIYLFILFILSGFMQVTTNEVRFRGYFLNLSPLILTVLAFIMGEIFAQGNQLSEENQLTV